MNLKINIDQTRDMGLDLVRVIALLLMTSVHFAKYIPASGLIPESMILIGEAAPVFFFFAFGITMDQFLKKDIDIKFRKLILFFFVCIAHNIYTCYLWNFKHGTIIVTEFLFFLWLWQFIIFSIEFNNKKNNFFYLLLLFIILLSVIITKPDTMESVFKHLIKGPFTIIPWGCFVISGLLFNRFELLKKWKSSLSICLLIILSITLLLIIDLKSNIDFISIKKRPLSISFILFFGSIACFTSIVFNNESIKNKILNFHLLIKGIQFLSKNLLLATVSHYFIYLLPFRIHPFIYKPEFINNHPVLMMISGSILIVIMLFVLLFAILKIWEKIKKLFPLRYMRKHYFFFSFLILFCCALPYGYYKNLEITNSTTIELMRSVMIYIMIYFTLEMNEIKNGKATENICYY